MNVEQTASPRGIIEKLLSFEPSRSKTIILVLLAVVVFSLLPIYKTLRQPRIGDDDVIRIGMLVLNRYSRDSFPRDIAFQAGDWWAGYTPSYLGILGIGYKLTGDLGLVFAILTAAVYLVLLTGFYRLGRAIGLPFIIALALAYMSGLYIVTGQALAWTGVGNEMATPRNLYLSAFPWMLLLATRLYQDALQKVRWWFVFGLILGISTIFHSVSGAVVISTFALMMLVGVCIRRFRWQNLLAYAVGVLPGAFIGYKSVSQILFVIVDPNVIGSFTAPPFIYDSIARADVFFYRIPAWALPIILFTIGTVIMGGLLIRKKRAGEPIPNALWISFGLIQFAALLLILVLDWWTLLVAVEWVRRVRNNLETSSEKLAMLYLAAVNLLALTLSSAFSLLSLTTSFSNAYGVARVFQRGGTLSYAALIVFTAFILWHHLRHSSARLLFLIAALATVVVGLQQGIFETIPGSWLPFDYWTYLGIALLLLWDRLDKDLLSQVRIAATVMILSIALSRLLAIMPDSIVIVLLGLITFAACWLDSRFSIDPIRRRILMVASGLAVILIIFLPFSGASFFNHVQTDTGKVLRRDWSRIDPQNRYSPLYPLGNWLRENTPPDSLILTNIPELRYWSFRSQTVSTLDAAFLYADQPVYNKLFAEGQRSDAAYQSPDALTEYGQETGADYVVVRKALSLPGLNSDAASIVFETDNFVVYALHVPAKNP